jgi:2-polyprenyl-3-methyl-5-hydroxy-6-metoxy-1,4-benzoquinol methylase
MTKAESFSDIAIEVVQDFWDSRPCNIRHSSKEPGTREYFDEVEQRRYFVEPHIPAFADFPRWKDKDVLEVGCGIGTDTVSFARQGARVTAMDLSPASVDIARQRAEVYGLSDRIQFVIGDAEALTEIAQLESYDLIYSFEVIHHSPHTEQILAQMRRLIRPTGEIKVMVYNRFERRFGWHLCITAVLDTDVDRAEASGTP